MGKRDGLWACQLRGREGMPVSKATARPWGFDAFGNIRSMHTPANDYASEHIASLDHYREERLPERKANAELICRAVNAHESLVAALKQMHEALDTLLAELDGQSGTYGWSRDAGYAALKLAKAALSKAEPGLPGRGDV